MSDIYYEDEDNNKDYSNGAGLGFYDRSLADTDEVLITIAEPHFFQFIDDDIPQNILFADVERIEFDDEMCLIIHTTKGKRFNVIFEWAQDPDDEDEAARNG